MVAASNLSSSCNSVPAVVDTDLQLQTFYYLLLLHGPLQTLIYLRVSAVFVYVQTMVSMPGLTFGIFNVSMCWCMWLHTTAVWTLEVSLHLKVNSAGEKSLATPGTKTSINIVPCFIWTLYQLNNPTPKHAFCSVCLVVTELSQNKAKTHQEGSQWHIRFAVTKLPLFLHKYLQLKKKRKKGEKRKRKRKEQTASLQIKIFL